MIALSEETGEEAIDAFTGAPLPNPVIENLFLDYMVPFRQDGLARAYYANGYVDKAIETYQRELDFIPSMAVMPSDQLYTTISQNYMKKKDGRVSRCRNMRFSSIAGKMRIAVYGNS